jgi:hypothetical protein
MTVRVVTRFAKIVAAGAASVAGALALVILARQLSLTFALCAIGPAFARTVVGFYGRFRLADLTVDRQMAALCVVGVLAGTGVWWIWLRRAIGHRFATIICEIIVGVAILGWSYRLQALLALASLVVWQVARRQSASFRVALAFGLFVALCLIPFDVTLQQVPGQPRVVPTSSCEGAQWPASQEGMVVCVGVWIYNAPSWVWVW